MANLAISSPPSAGAIRFYLVSDRTGKRFGRVYTLTPDQNEVVLDVPPDIRPITIFWNQLGGTESRVYVQDETSVTLAFETPNYAIRLKPNSPVPPDPENDTISLPSMPVSSIYADSTELRPLKAWQLTNRQAQRFYRRHPQSGARQRVWGAIDRELVPDGWQVFEPRERLLKLDAIDGHNRRVEIAFSMDPEPGNRPEWQPFNKDWEVALEQRSNAFSIFIRIPELDPDPNQPPDVGFSVRMSLALEGQRLQQLLIPLYSGGVEIIANSSSVISDQFDVSILPISPQMRLMAQTLVPSNTRSREEITQLVCSEATRTIDSISEQHLYDPWAVLLAGLNVRMFDWDMSMDWIATVVSRFSWISDFLVLEAWWWSSQSDGRNLGRAVDLLSRARKRSNLYFAESHQTLRDILVWLASDAPSEGLKRKASNELLALRLNSKANVWAGAQYSWMIGNSTTSGEIRDRSSQVYISGKVTPEFIGAEQLGILSFDDDS